LSVKFELVCESVFDDRRQSRQLSSDKDQHSRTCSSLATTTSRMSGN